VRLRNTGLSLRRTLHPAGRSHFELELISFFRTWQDSDVGGLDLQISQKSAPLMEKETSSIGTEK
jgi:hypothetical protein